MGSLAKRMGQLAAKSVESESAKILKATRSNKVEGSLGRLFDRTLKESHNMYVFGLGTLCAMASTERYARFTTAMHGVYSTMETELGRCDDDSANGVFWRGHGDILRRTPALTADLKDVGVDLDRDDPSYSPQTLVYMDAIREAGDSDRKTGGIRLLGHAYCRYLADLMGGQALGTPTKMALALPVAPRHYAFDWERNGHRSRAEYVESMYRDFNVAGKNTTQGQRQDAFEEAKRAFALNVDVYSEEPLWLDSIRGAANIATGFVRGR